MMTKYARNAYASDRRNQFNLGLASPSISGSMMPSNNQAEDVVASKLTSTSENDVELRELQSSHQQMDRESRTASEYSKEASGCITF